MLKRNLTTVKRVVKSWPTENTVKAVARPLSTNSYRQRTYNNDSSRENAFVFNVASLFAAAAVGMKTTFSEKAIEKNGSLTDINYVSINRLERLARAEEKPLYQLKSANLLQSLRDIKGKKLAIMLGRAGVGKSTSIIYNQGFQLRKVKNYGIIRAEVVEPGSSYASKVFQIFSPASPIKYPSHPIIGENQSTFMPETYENITKENQYFVWCDFPGFLDQGLQEEKILTSVVKDLAIQVSDGIQAVGVALQESDLDENSPVILEAFIEELRQWGSLKVIKSSLFFVITKSSETILADRDPISCIMRKIDVLLEKTNIKFKILNEIINNDPFNIKNREELNALKNKIEFLELMKENKEHIVLLNPFDHGESRAIISKLIHEKTPISPNQFSINSTTFPRAQFDLMLNEIALFGRSCFDLLNELSENKEQLKFLNDQEKLKKIINDLEAQKSGLELEVNDLEKSDLILDRTESQPVNGIMYNWTALSGLVTDTGFLQDSYEVAAILIALFTSETGLSLSSIVFTVLGLNSKITTVSAFKNAKLVMEEFLEYAKTNPNALIAPLDTVQIVAKRLLDKQIQGLGNSLDQITSLVSKVLIILNRIEIPIRESKKIKLTINSLVKIDNVKTVPTQGEISSFSMAPNGCSYSVDYLPAWYTSPFQPAMVNFSIYIQKKDKPENRISAANKKEQIKYITAQIDFLKKVEKNIMKPDWEMIKNRINELEGHVEKNSQKIKDNMERFKFVAELCNLVPELENGSKEDMALFMSAYRTYIGITNKQQEEAPASSVTATKTPGIGRL